MKKQPKVLGCFIECGADKEANFLERCALRPDFLPRISVSKKRFWWGRTDIEGWLDLQKEKRPMMRERLELVYYVFDKYKYYSLKFRKYQQNYQQAALSKAKLGGLVAPLR